MTAGAFHNDLVEQRRSAVARPAGPVRHCRGQAVPPHVPREKHPTEPLTEGEWR